MTRLLDAFALLLAGLASAAVAWASFHYLGQDGFWLVPSLAIMSLMLDNRSLRRCIRQLERDAGPPPAPTRSP